MREKAKLEQGLPEKHLETGDDARSDRLRVNEEPGSTRRINGIEDGQTRMQETSRHQRGIDPGIEILKFFFLQIP